MFQHRYSSLREIDNLYLSGVVVRFQVDSPYVLKWGERAVPGYPFRLRPKFGGGLACAEFEGSREGFGAFVAALQSNVQHGTIMSKCKPVARAFQAGELNIPVDANAEYRRKLAVKVEFGEGRNVA